MQTDFSPEQRADPPTAAAETVIRKCVHCGFCIATCPTYVLLGDELDSPRGRIYLIKNMLETEEIPTAQVVKHIDRCLSCLSCMTTCPSGVNYMHLVDHARSYIEARYRRPLSERLIRAMLAAILPNPRRLRVALGLARFVTPAAPVLHRVPALRPLAAMLALTPKRLAVVVRDPVAPQPVTGRVALLRGCAEPVLRPGYREAAVRLLGRAGYAVVSAPGEGCCGALVHHIGYEAKSREAARRNVDAWMALIAAERLDAIVTTASGCGTMIKDYSFMLREDPAYAAKAATISALTRDISEFLIDIDLPPGDGRGLTVAYHSACSLQHGQRVTEAPKRLLAHAGYTVLTPVEAHLCCGSAGTYNILQPEIAGQLRDRKAANIDRLGADVIATGNIGCAIQLERHVAAPIAHVVELLDWATGGPAPPGISAMRREGGTEQNRWGGGMEAEPSQHQ